MINYKICYRDIRLKPMTQNHIGRFAALFDCPRKERREIVSKWMKLVENDIQEDVITNFIIIYDNAIIGAVQLDYVMSRVNGYECYSDAKMKIRLPREKYLHLASDIANAMVNLCRNTYLADNLIIPTKQNGNTVWNYIPIVPQESNKKTA